MTTGLSYREVRKTEGLRNRDSAVYYDKEANIEDIDKLIAVIH